MQTAPPLENLRREIASVLSDEKAYNLPKVCVRYGLAPGSDEEAFSSKSKYVSARLSSLERNDVMAVARRILKDNPHPRILEAIARVDELGRKTISELTRRRIMKIIENITIEGELGMEEFLDPIFDIDSHPSKYRSSGKTYRDDIQFHYEFNQDLDGASILRDLGIMTCSEARFFAFIERLMDPIVREGAAREALRSQIDAILTKEGYTLTKTSMIAGAAIYKVSKVETPGITPADLEHSTTFARFDESGIKELWQKALKRRDDDPEGAITLARTLLERTCKHILDEEGCDYPEASDLPKLWHQCAHILKLAPSQHTEEVFKSILGNCQSVVTNIATIRNRIGDSHAQRGRPVKPRPRHAQLVVNLSGTMATFILETWQRQREEGDR